MYIRLIIYIAISLLFKKLFTYYYFQELDICSLKEVKYETYIDENYIDVIIDIQLNKLNEFCSYKKECYDDYKLNDCINNVIDFNYDRTCFYYKNYNSIDDICKYLSYNENKNYYYIFISVLTCLIFYYLEFGFSYQITKKSYIKNDEDFDV